MCDRWLSSHGNHINLTLKLLKYIQQGAGDRQLPDDLSDLSNQVDFLFTNSTKTIS